MKCISSVTCMAVMALFSEGQGLTVAQPQSVVRDGDYVGLQKMPNLSPNDRQARWFHENTLVIRKDEAILEKVPITIRHGAKSYSASDGGFLTYRARFTKRDGQTVVQMRLFESDCVLFPVGKHDQYTEIKTYPVTFVSDQIEFDDVRYKLSKVESWKLDRLVPLLELRAAGSFRCQPASNRRGFHGGR